LFDLLEPLQSITNIISASRIMHHEFVDNTAKYDLTISEQSLLSRLLILLRYTGYYFLQCPDCLQ